MKLPSNIFLILMLGLAGCSEERAITDDAFQKELMGRKSEALYLYGKALKKNPNYPPANKRVGMILAESEDSIGVAIHHLEKTREFASSDEETDLKLFDLYILTEDFTKLQALQEELKESLSEEDSGFLDIMVLCHKNPSLSRGIATKTKLSEKVKFYELRAQLLSGCKKKAGISQ